LIAHIAEQRFIVRPFEGESLVGTARGLAGQPALERGCFRVDRLARVGFERLELARREKGRLLDRACEDFAVLAEESAKRGRAQLSARRRRRTSPAMSL
jgi:hypothetical protein